MKYLKLEEAKQLYEIHQSFNKHTEPICECGYISDDYENTKKFVINFIKRNKDKIYDAMNYLYQINKIALFFEYIAEYFKDSIDWNKVDQEIVKIIGRTLAEYIPVHKFKFTPGRGNYDKSYIEKYIIERNNLEEITYYINRFKPTINGLYLYADEPEKYFLKEKLLVNMKITYTIVNNDERLEKLDKLLKKKVGAISVIDEYMNEKFYDKKDVITLFWNKKKYGLIYLIDEEAANYIVIQDFNIKNIDDFFKIVNSILEPYYYKLDLYKYGTDLYLNGQHYGISMETIGG